MRKLVLASATMGILAVGAIANAHADGRDLTERRGMIRTQQESAANMRGEVWLGPGQTAPAYRVAPVEPIYEGRNVYVAPAPVVVPGPVYRSVTPTTTPNNW